MDFPISRQARKRYKFEDSLFSFNGNVIFANFHSARVFAQRMNAKRDLVVRPELDVKAGQVNAMGMIDEILHLVATLYRQQKSPRLHNELWAYLESIIGKRRLTSTIRAFTRDFPPPSVSKKLLTVDEFLDSETNGISNLLIALEELILLRLANMNPAFQSYNELFDDSSLMDKTAYSKIFKSATTFFDQQPRFGPDTQNLIEMLRSPAIAVPHSLKGQLDYIRSRWGNLLGHYLLKLLGSLDMISEEEHFRGIGPGPVCIPVYKDFGEMEIERFSPDADWMPDLVLLAKNAYVWLDQLSRRYQRPIKRLDEIPDEVLDQLAGWGFTGLWLIGIWERSRASARIKQLCGNPEAIASAYSLKRYQIAQDLGGEIALDNLTRRARERSIRLASDMVPNHMAIDSDWIYEHPDWFLSLPHSPFPSYSFQGPNLSEDDRAEVHIEDHYFDRSDAAVVFQYFDRSQKKHRFIYHGNDGTSMPWNDTAQLNYLNPTVREEVIQTILGVARKFPIIRFDAAMTLAKRHYQRLWFPEPGSGCDIPSRSEFGLTKEQFNRYMPNEFWRDVVDRVAKETPDTLLLAEAFWLMEGYFVRTLGMHRVYNSAFMNLLRDEDNAKYRQVIKNTMEFDREILKRFVNFMNNPDEHTTVSQFGKGDKYFGICTMLATMPGLPMFGHGQIEGYSEKYGMEYKKAYWDEQQDSQLIDRHIWQIFPLLKKRFLFAGVDYFYLYDLFTQGGTVDENVFAYSNRAGKEKTLIVYHNKFGDTSGWIRTSTSFMDKTIGAIRQIDISTGLDLSESPNDYVVFRDQLNGLEYIHNCEEIKRKGLFIQLNAYRAHVFLDFRVVTDSDQRIWRQVNDYLNGRGTTDMEALRWQVPLESVLQPLREIANPAYFHFLVKEKPKTLGSIAPVYLLNEADHKLRKVISGAAQLLGQSIDSSDSCRLFKQQIESLYQIPWQDQQLTRIVPDTILEFLKWLRERFTDTIWLALIGSLFLNCLGNSLGMDADQLLSLMEDWRVFTLMESALWEMNSNEINPGDYFRFLTLFLKLDQWLVRFGRMRPGNIFRDLLKDNFFKEFLRINTYGEKVWFGKESMEMLITIMGFEAVLEIHLVKKQSSKRLHFRMGRLCDLLLSFISQANYSGYDLDKFLKGLDQPFE